MPRNPRRSDVVKRALDIGTSVIGLIVTAPIQAGVAVVVLATHGRPVFFRQERPGKNAEIFKLIKFRTMLLPDEKHVTDDERITSVGRFLRSTSLDELPTLWNVLKGDMSIVGPRPLLVSYLDKYSPDQARRHEVRPGVTGLAQVSGRNQVSWERRFELDLEYVESRNLGVDFKILLQTVRSVLRREGINQKGHVTMSMFTGSAMESDSSASA